MIDSQQAGAALSDIDDIVRRVRQSQFYRISGLIVIMWGVLVVAGYVATYARPQQGYAIWIAADLIGIAGSIAISAFSGVRSGAGTYAIRMTIALLLFVGFGFYCSVGLGHFGPRQVIVFWTLYTMLFYALAGLWFGYAFVAIALCTSALTLVGYHYAFDMFLLWMAATYGGALILGGLWMCRT
jgi:hypothetical protein